MRNIFEEDENTRAFIALVKGRKGHWTPPEAEGGIFTTDELVTKSLPSVQARIKAELLRMLAELDGE